MQTAALYLQTASFDRVEHEEFLQQVFTVCGHVERDTVLSPQDPLPQLLHTRTHGETHEKSAALSDFFGGPSQKTLSQYRVVLM